MEAVCIALMFTVAVLMGWVCRLLNRPTKDMELHLFLGAVIFHCLAGIAGLVWFVYVPK